MRDSSTIVARGPLAWASLESAEPRRLWRFVTPIAAALLIFSAAASEVPYVAHYPGGATAVHPLVGVPSDRAHPAAGRILLTTVAQDSRPRLIDVFFGWLDPDVAVYPRDQVLGDRTPQEFQQVNLRAIDDSKEVAVAVALRRLGFPVEQTGQGAIIEVIGVDVPARSLLRPGDVIVAAAGQPVALVDDVMRAVAARQPGDVLALEVVGPDGAARSVSVPLVPCPADVNCPEGAGVMMGVGLRTRGLSFDLPFEVSIESQDIGGPSAGLAFALTVIDLLTPGELTGGETVAVTGEIDLDGNVGPIGGVGQKAAAVTDAGVRFFLVPAANAEEAQRHAGDGLTIIPVTNLESALMGLARIGGDVSVLPVPQ